ncbi:GDSL-type esterase/lipase family protein [Coleofasciculus sp. LEGE 07081]|uniref:GDSL-type esterase/lipase family protein n=1 Tax=Coleofasciculus sp. LEGE 07081 TaxID=2777967 RepID=UPI001D13D1F8|nr:GDSL-type esterase/lipase family protein [Coleofasciculus sp. LEGE 07081]
MSYLVSKVSFWQPEKQQEVSRPRKNTYQTGYHDMRKRLFEELPNSDREIIFVGDSLTDGGEWVELLGNPSIRNRGISGDTTDGVLNRLDELVESNPPKIFIMIGTNDIWNEGKSATEVAQNYKGILERIKQQTPKTQVFVQSVLPVNNKQYQIKVDNNELMALNRQLQELANQFSFQYIDLYSSFINEENQLNSDYTLDGVHLNGQGYLLWKKGIENYVNIESKKN